MGSILNATCPCGFSSGGLVGGGFMSFQTYCGAPAICESCGAFNFLNYLEDDPRCEQCGGTVRFYNDPELQEQADSPGALDSMTPAERSERIDWLCEPKYPIFSWNLENERGPFVLPDVGYLCPSCRRKTMRFEGIGAWD